MDARCSSRIWAKVGITGTDWRAGASLGLVDYSLPNRAPDGKRVAGKIRHSTPRITMMNRSQPRAAPHVGFTQLELYLLDTLIRDKARAVKPTNSLGTYLVKLARLGGYLARAHDPPPGNNVMWRSLTRLTDIDLGAIIGAQLMSN